MNKFIEVTEYVNLCILPKKYEVEPYIKEKRSERKYRDINKVKTIINLDAIKSIYPFAFACENDEDEIIVRRYSVCLGKDQTVHIDEDDYKRIKELLFEEEPIKTL